jgi:hypothetical protein
MEMLGDHLLWHTFASQFEREEMLEQPDSRI